MEEDPIEKTRNASFEDQVRHNMKTAQLAAEHYAADHSGTNYPAVMDDVFKTYFPGGQDGRRPAPVGMVNPFTGENEFPIVSHVVKDPVTAQNQPRFEVPKGKIYYCILNDGKGYAIVGGAHDDKALMDKNNPEHVLVLSNVL